MGGPFAPYVQSQRRRYYLEALEKLRVSRFVYPCKCSRKDVMQASLAPHEEEPIYPGTCRPRGSVVEAAVPAAGRDFGDFIVWRRDDVSAYQLAVVVDDAAMQISEVVRGEDLLMSTFRQLLLYRALDLLPPKFYHAPLVLDESGKQLAKRHGALSLRALHEGGATPEEIRALGCQL